MEYRQTNVTGNSYRRANAIFIRNDLDKAPQAEMEREDIFVFGDTTIKQKAPTLPIPFVAEKVIILLNPETGEPLGSTITMQELFVILFSLFVQESTVFDNPVAP